MPNNLLNTKEAAPQLAFKNHLTLLAHIRTKPDSEISLLFRQLDNRRWITTQNDIDEYLEKKKQERLIRIA